jgi:SnoaL-like domain
MNTLELDNQVNALIMAGRNREAFLEFYDENVVKQENDGPELRGREEWMRTREAWARDMEHYEPRLLANAANGDVSFSEWELGLQLKGSSPTKQAQAVVRHWRNGRVIRERWYHK